MFIAHLDSDGESDGENRLGPDRIAALNSIIDDALETEGPVALVTTGAGKYYSTGADLAWGAQNPDRIDWYLTQMQALLARILTLPIPTVAALNGHTYGAGAFLAVAHDHRVMRADRGYVCFPGVALGANYHYGGVALVRSRLPVDVAHDALVSGRRYGAEEARAARLVDAVAEQDRVLPQAVEYARSLAHTRGPVLGGIKVDLHRHAVAALTETVEGYNDHALTRI